MSIPIIQLLLILFAHTIGDFVLQTRSMAENKSIGYKTLFNHCIIYSLPIAILGSILSILDISFPQPIYLIVNIMLHFIVDFFTSRLSKKFYLSNQMNHFWWCIGFDQFLHISCLVLTYNLFVQNI